MSGEVLFSGKENVEDWESVDSGSPNQEDYNDFDIDFVDTEDIEEGDFWIGEYTGTRFIGQEAQSKSVMFDNEEEEVSYGFPSHVALKTQVEDTDLEDHQERSDNPVEKGEVVAIRYNGTTPVDGRPMDMHLWELKRPPE